MATAKHKYKVLVLFDTAGTPPADQDFTKELKTDDWAAEAHVIDALKQADGELVVINYGSDGFEGTDLDRLLRASNIGHLFVSGQCIEHVVATTIKRAANMGYNAILIKDATSGFTDGNYAAMLDILPLYSKVITSAQFALEAPYGSVDRRVTTPSKDSFAGRLAWLRS